MIFLLLLWSVFMQLSKIAVTSIPLSVSKMVSISVLAIFASSCQTSTINKDELTRTLKENPDIINQAILAHPAQYIETLQSAAKLAQEDLKKKQQDDEKTKLEDAFKNPLVASIRADEAIRGTKGAPITLVEYSDFECPFCSRSHETVKNLLKKYEGKIQFVYKHLPLNFHEQAMISAQYYEAIRLQSNDKAFKFHDEIFQNQRKLKNGKAFLDEVAKKINVDMNRLKKDLESDTVKNRIAEDMAEAQKFGMEGTPGFILNGVPIKGAYPEEYFDQILSELKQRGKLAI